VCTTIDRGTFQATRIGAGTKIDNLVMIGHNCRIGRHNMLVSQVGIAGSCTTGDYVVMAGQVGVAGHLRLPRARGGRQVGGLQGRRPARRWQVFRLWTRRSGAVSKRWCSGWTSCSGACAP
jgi:hypothetical protein